MLSEYEIYGKVVSINYSNTKEFTIKTFPNPTTHSCICNFFCPLDLGDIIYGTVTKINNKLNFCNQPLVQLPIDKESIINFYIKSLKDFGVNYDFCSVLYNTLNDENQNISILSISYIKTKKNSIIEDINSILNIDSNIIVKLLTTWYFKRILRRLYLFGLTNKEIKNSNLSEIELFDVCSENPHKIYSILPDKIENIMKSFNKESSTTEIMCGKIVRKVYDLREKSGWVCVPFNFLQKIFKNLYTFKETLMSDYDLIFENNYVYLNYCHKVESTVCDFINEKLKIENTMDTVIDDDVFKCKTLTSEQKIAINGVLNNEISILTGGPGCGKCLDPNTGVLMYNGDIKIIKDIKINEFIMGDDSTPRKVLSVCEGEETMYDIIPKIGYSFRCNGPHILTLQGLIPQIYSTYNKWVIKYTQLGISKIKEFNNLNDCNSFRYTLPDDIYDISVNEYLKGRHIGYIIHSNVKFQPTKLHNFPYIIGYELDYFKKINTVYKINSYNNRLYLLSGIIDKLGSLYKKTIIIKYCSMCFLKDVEFIALSLGLLAFIKNKILHIIGKLCILQCERIILNSIDEDIVNNDFTINNVGVGKYCGFELNGNGRFLLEDFTITHNTTIIGEIINILESNSSSFICASFTGKAVVRLQEVIGKKNMVYTLDKLIKLNSLKFEYLILDESSMITTELFYRFLEIFKHSYKIIIVGDINQLQPISWGSFMKQLIDCNRIPTYKLTYNHRLSDKNNRTIIENCSHLIDPKRNIEYPIIFKYENGFNFINGNIKVVELLLNTLFKNNIPYSKISIICPYNKYLDSLNCIVQTIYLSTNKNIYDKSRNKNWYVGDRVMMLYNNYELDIMNGEEGVVVDIELLGIFVEFKKIKHFFKFDNEIQKKKKGMYDDDIDMSELKTIHLDHSTAITVHKIQGSENEFIIIFLPDEENSSFLNCNLLYTALTRTKTILWIVGSTKALQNTASKTQKSRQENLCKKLIALDPSYSEDANEDDDYYEEDMSMYEKYYN